MKRLIITLALLGLISGTVGCTDRLYGLKDVQKTDLLAWEGQGVDYVQEKSTVTASKRGFWLGLGAFYTDQPVLGAIDLLTWPVSIIWEPWIASAAANQINYEATKNKWMREKGIGIYGHFEQVK